MNKAFTLIELLAVIVMLAVIALIATPIILNIIGSAKNETIKISKELYLKAVDQAIATRNLKEEFNPSECGIQKDGNLLCGDENLVIEVSGIKPCGGKITFDKNGKIIKETVTYCNDDVPQIVEYVDNSGANAPELMNGTLIPVKYDGNSWKIADTTKEWYDYDKEEWANAVVLSETGKSKKSDEILDLASDVLAMFVWIPRYEYKIDTTDDQFGKGSIDKSLPGEIEINFIDKNTTTSSSEEYFVHPAFTFDGTQLSGIWVGKFETSHTTKSKGAEPTDNSANLGCIDETCLDADNLRILPDIPSLRYNSLSSLFYASRSMSKNGNIFGFSSTILDSHMMKNSEWGAVAYLSQSKYGKYGNSDYVGVYKEIYKNNSSGCYTGRSSGLPPENGSTLEGTCHYDDITNRTNGTGSCGGGASTTGNIYGIYDMNGGAYDYVMGNYNGVAGQSGFSSTFLNNEIKYFDKYTSDSLENCSDFECKGHALVETNGWYQDKATFVSSSSPWFIRGHGYDNGTTNGIFSYMGLDGHSGYIRSFHITLVPII